MRKILIVAGVAGVLCLAAAGSFAKAPPASKGGSATIVIVFKDGHRQSFSLADVARVEFPTAAAEATIATAPVNSLLPLRGHFVGKWEVGDGVGGNFFMTLDEDGEAHRSIGNERGHWVYVNGEARVTWNDGAQDAIRKVGPVNQKFAYGRGKSFTDEPDNVTNARNITPGPS